jgi:hypothetical protein
MKLKRMSCDVLVFLNCCYSSSGAILAALRKRKTSGGGRFEIICSAPFNSNSSSPGSYSFGLTLVNELSDSPFYLNSSKTFTSAQLHEAIVRTLFGVFHGQLYKDGTRGHYAVQPSHWVLTEGWTTDPARGWIKMPVLPIWKKIVEKWQIIIRAAQIEHQYCQKMLAALQGPPTPHQLFMERWRRFKRDQRAGKKKQ